MKILLGVSGSVAATLTTKLKVELALKGHEIKTVATSSALNFKENSAWGDILKDEDEWYEYKFKRKVLHIELIKWADVFVIAPATVNTISKMANGLSDNLLTNCALAWNYNKPIFVAPAMNCVMLTHPATQKNIQTIINFGVQIIEPQEKILFCGDKGNGAMASIETIVETIQ